MITKLTNLSVHLNKLHLKLLEPNKSLKPLRPLMSLPETLQTLLKLQHSEVKLDKLRPKSITNFPTTMFNSCQKKICT